MDHLPARECPQRLACNLGISERARRPVCSSYGFRRQAAACCCRFLVAAGDPCQLPPVVASPSEISAQHPGTAAPADKPAGQALGHGLARPLFERLVSMGHTAHLLRRQYRRAAVLVQTTGCDWVRMPHEALHQWQQPGTSAANDPVDGSSTDTSMLALDCLDKAFSSKWLPCCLQRFGHCSEQRGAPAHLLRFL